MIDAMAQKMEGDAGPPTGFVKGAAGGPLRQLQASACSCYLRITPVSGWVSQHEDQRCLNNLFFDFIGLDLQCFRQSPGHKVLLLF